MGVEQIHQMVEQGDPVSENPDATIDDLAKLSQLDYAIKRKAEAKRLGIPLAILDREVKGRQRGKDQSAGQGKPLELPEPEPWSDPVDGSVLLSEISSFIRRFVVLPPGAADAVALWTVFTHIFEVFDTSPRLTLLSPTKRCGKTTLLGKILPRLVARPLVASNITAAATYRTVEVARPTLLIDEADTFLRDNEPLRGILNSGHSREGNVVRTVGQDYTPRTFSTWCPLAIALIGKLHPTLIDRSIVIRMRRKSSAERVERLSSMALTEMHDLARKASRWVADHAEAFGNYDPTVPAELHDRAADNWRPLLSIADAAGGDWPERARNAAIALSLSENEEPELAELLIRDIRDVFERGASDRIKSDELCRTLATMQGRPWAEWKSAKPITPNQLARLLRDFGISPGTIRLGRQTAKGYSREAFADAFERYRSPDGNVTTSQSQGENLSGEAAGNL